MRLFDAVVNNNIEAVRQLLCEGASPTEIVGGLVNILFVSLKLMKKFVFYKDDSVASSCCI